MGASEAGGGRGDRWGQARLVGAVSRRAKSLVNRTLPIALDVTLLACLTVRSQASSQDALKHTPEYALKYTPNCTR